METEEYYGGMYPDPPEIEENKIDEWNDWNEWGEPDDLIDEVVYDQE